MTDSLKSLLSGMLAQVLRQDLRRKKLRAPRPLNRSGFRTESKPSDALPPFTPRHGQRMPQIEYSPYIDASEIAWSGALDGICDPSAPPWSDWAAKDRYLFDRGFCPGVFELRHCIVGIESLTEARLEVHFERVAPVRVGESPLTFRQLLFMAATPCPMGGQRWWFTCTLCSRRCARLFRSPSGFLECRKCCGLTYKTQQVHNKASRHGRGLRRLWAHLDCEPRWIEAAARRTNRRGLSRWRKDVRGDEQYRIGLPVLVTGRPLEPAPGA